MVDTSFQKFDFISMLSFHYWQHAKGQAFAAVEKVPASRPSPSNRGSPVVLTGKRGVTFREKEAHSVASSQAAQCAPSRAHGTLVAARGQPRVNAPFRCASCGTHALRSEFSEADRCSVSSRAFLSETGLFFKVRMHSSEHASGAGPVRCCRLPLGR